MAETQVNLSSVNLSPGGVLGFLAETPVAFIAEHLSKGFVDGAPAMDGVNISIVSDGSVGANISAVPEPSSGLLDALALITFAVIRRNR